MNSNDVALAYGALINKTWKDPGFKQALMSDPKGAITSLGFSVPPGTTIEVLQSTPDKVYISLPPNPAELSEVQLDAVAAGKASGGIYTGPTTDEKPKGGSGPTSGGGY